MKKNITTLEELEKEQEKLSILMAVTRQEFAQNLGTNRKQLTNYLLKSVALPAGAVGLGIAAVNGFSNPQHKDTTPASNSSFWKTLLPLGLNLIQVYLNKEESDQQIY